MSKKVVIKTSDVTKMVQFGCVLGLSAVVDSVEYDFLITDSTKNWHTSECKKAIVGNGVIYKYGKS
jgi:hypothetical protein